MYLAEIATPGNRGFHCAWQLGSQQVAVMIAALIGAVLTGSLTAEQAGRFAWRAPLLIGCAIIPLILWLRRSLDKTEAFRRMQQKPHSVAGLLAANWGLVLVGMGLLVLTTAASPLIAASAASVVRFTDGVAVSPA